MRGSGCSVKDGSGCYSGGFYARCGGRSLREAWGAGEYARDEGQVLYDGLEMNFTSGLGAM